MADIRASIGRGTLWTTSLIEFVAVLWTADAVDLCVVTPSGRIHAEAFGLCSQHPQQRKVRGMHAGLTADPKFTEIRVNSGVRFPISLRVPYAKWWQWLRHPWWQPGYYFILSSVTKITTVIRCLIRLKNACQQVRPMWLNDSLLINSAPARRRGMSFRSCLSVCMSVCLFVCLSVRR